MDRIRFEQRLIRRLSRRRLLAGTLVGAISLPGRPTRSCAQEEPAPVGAAYPFTLGVASGDPLSDGVVLWTRLARDPLNGGGMPPEPIAVRWEVATAEDFGRIVRRGTATATPELAHSVHIDVAGLEPCREYFYRFIADGEVSPVGRTRTAPAAGATLDRLRFGFASCAHWESGYFVAYRHLANEDLDLVLFLGDYIYETGPNEDVPPGIAAPGRLHTGPGRAVTLAEYRNRHAQYKTDPDLQLAHARLPWVTTWDDHEVEDNYAGATSRNDDPAEVFLARRAAAYQAYYEHLPLRPASMPQGPAMRLYRRLTFGALAEFSVLDTRQYRSPHPCGNTIARRCPAALDPAQTMTGPEQERWLLDGLTASPARWNVIAQQVMMGELAVRVPGREPRYNDDQWDGYPLARQRLLGHVRDAGVRNAVVLTGDAHSAWALDLQADFLDPASPVVATEFVTASISARNPVGGWLALLRGGNPHIRYLDLRHGYTVCDLAPARWQADFRAVPSATDPGAPIATVGSFVVEDGKPGVEPA